MFHVDIVLYNNLASLKTVLKLEEKLYKITIQLHFKASNYLQLNTYRKPFLILKHK